MRIIKKIIGLLYVVISLAIYGKNFVLDIIKTKKELTKYKEEKLNSTFDLEITNKLIDCIEEIRAKIKIPSIQLSLEMRNGGSFNYSSGSANVENSELVNLNSLYYLGSITKTYTYAVILKLEQDGLISLNDKVENYINISPVGKDVTIKHLLNHSSGLYDPLISKYPLFQTYYFGKKWSYDKIIKSIKKNKPYFEPGKGRMYSNTGYILLGMIAEIATGKSFFTLLKELFLNPFELKNTFYTYEEKVSNSLTTGYDKADYRIGKLGLVANVEKFPVILEKTSLTSGGLVANSQDVCEFLYKLFESDVLTQEYKRKMRLAFDTLGVCNYRMRSRQGFIIGYKNFSGYIDSEKVYIVALSNLSYIPENDQVVYEGLIEKILNILVSYDLMKN